MTLPTSVDALKSTVGRRGGFARSNRFALYMSNPAGQNILTGGGGGIGGALSGVASNAIRGVLSGGSFNPMAFLNDPRDIYLLCESCSIPGKNIATEERKTSMKSVKMPYQYIMEDVTFVFNLTNDYYIWKYFKGWMDKVLPSADDIHNHRFNYKNEYTTDIIIQQMAQQDFVPVHSIKLKNAYPVTINSIELSNQVADDTLRCTVVMTYDTWEEQGIVEGLLDVGKNTISNIIGKKF